MGLTVAPVGAWPLAWIAIAPLWVLVVASTKQQNQSLPLAPAPPHKSSPSQELPFSLLWGIGYHGLALWWITGVHPMTWMGVPWLASLAIALFCWIFITLWGAALVASWAVAMALLTRTVKGWSRVLIGVALWCGLESFWSTGSLWWTSVSYTQSPHNLAILHLGQLSGPSTITAAIVAVNGFIAEAWINRRQEKTTSPILSSAFSAPTASFPRQYEGGTPVRGENPSSPDWLVNPPSSGLGGTATPETRSLRFVFHQGYLSIATGLLIALHLIGFGLYSQPLIEPPATALKVGIIQGNVPNEIKLYPAGFRRAIESYTTGYQTLASQGVDAVLTPEGALPFFQSDLMNSSFFSAVREKGVIAWVGAFGEQGRSYTNSLFTVTGNGQFFSRYNKVKLVPIGEYIPFEQFVGGIVKRLSPLDEHQVAGLPTQVFNTPFGRAIAGICYDSAFSEHFRRQAATGGQFILSASNDAHYSPSMPAQHHAQDIMRAIETDRWALRATNTGYSGVVDPHGRQEWISGIHTYEIHAARIYRRQTQTLYVRWGDWLTPLLLVLGALAWLLNRTAMLHSAGDSKS